MDLARFESRKHADDGVEFPLRNTVTGEEVTGRDGKPVTFCVGHWDGPRIRAAVTARRKERTEERKKETNKAAEVDPNQAERDACDDLASMTTGWSDNFDLDGQPCAFSHDTAAAIYYRFPEILEQMGRNAQDRANFLLGLAKI